MNKELPEEVDMETALEELVRLAKKHLQVKEVDMDSIQYKGPGLHKSMLHLISDLKETFTKECLDYHKKQNRSFLEVLLISAFQLGWSAKAVDYENNEKPFRELLESVEGKLAIIKKEENDGKTFTRRKRTTSGAIKEAPRY